jgi:hypothetical protein
MISRRRALVLVSVLAVALFDRAQSASDKEKPLVYDDVTEGSDAHDREAKKTYAGKFRFSDITQKEGFSPGGMKGIFTSSIRFRDPRSMRDEAIPGEIVYTFIVTPDGRVIEPRVLHSTDERVTKYILKRISYDRYFPARYRGLPVYSLQLDLWKFGGPDTTSPRQYNDGLGVYHSRDR